MLIYHRTSILTSQAQTVVNTVNTVGVMGKGLASKYKSRFPEMYKRYRVFCKSGQLDIGNLWLWKGEDQWVLNFPTKKHWRNPSKIEYVELGLQKFVAQYESRGITEIAFPRLGCGNGGLEWNDVQALMEHYLANLPIQVYIHDYEKNIGLPEHHEKTDGSDLFSNEPFTVHSDRSFSGFTNNIRKVIDSKSGKFSTIKKGMEFSISFDTENNLIVSTPVKKLTILEEDIFDLWVMLIKGPVSKENLSGSAFEAAYFIFSLLVHFPDIRPIQIAPKKGDGTLAIEMQKDTPTQIAVNG